MKCPARIFVVQQGLDVGTGYMPDCLQGECAWWDKTRDQCCIKSACNGIMGIMSDTMAIREQLPRASAFRK